MIKLFSKVYCRRAPQIESLHIHTYYIVDNFDRPSAREKTELIIWCVHFNQTRSRIYHSYTQYREDLTAWWRNGPEVARWIRNQTVPGSNPVMDT